MSPSGSSSKITPKDLRRVRPVTDGLDRMKADIARGSGVWCICSVGRDYHVGAHDAEDIFEKAAQRGEIKIRRDNGHRIFVPAHPARGLSVEAGEERCRRDMERGYGILAEAYEGYDRGRERLIDQGEQINETFLRAFRQLRRVRILPITTGNPAFSHPSMALLMDQCFRDEKRLVEYLRKPDLLEVADPADAPNAERLELLERKLRKGELSAPEARRLRELNRRIRELIPVVRDEDYEALEDTVAEVQNVVAEDLRRREKLGLS